MDERKNNFHRRRGEIISANKPAFNRRAFKQIQKLKHKLNFLILVLMLALPALSWAQAKPLTKADWPQVIKNLDCNLGGRPFLKNESTGEYDAAAGHIYAMILDSIGASRGISDSMALASVKAAKAAGQYRWVLAFVGAISSGPHGPCISFTDTPQLIWACPWKKVGGGWELYLRDGCDNPDLVFIPGDSGSDKSPCDSVFQVVHQHFYFGDINFNFAKFDFNVDLLDGYGGGAGFSYKGDGRDTSGNNGDLLSSSTNYGDIIDKSRTKNKYKNRCCVPKTGVTRSYVYGGYRYQWGGKPFYTGEQYFAGFRLVSNKIKILELKSGEERVRKPFGWTAGAEFTWIPLGPQDSVPCTNCGHYNQARLKNQGAGIVVFTGVNFSGWHDAQKRDAWLRIDADWTIQYAPSLGGLNGWPRLYSRFQGNIQAGPVRLTAAVDYHPFKQIATPEYDGGEFIPSLSAAISLQTSGKPNGPRAPGVWKKVIRPASEWIWEEGLQPAAHGTWRAMKWIGRGFKKQKPATEPMPTLRATWGTFPGDADWVYPVWYVRERKMDL